MTLCQVKKIIMTICQNIWMCMKFDVNL